jgi:hypothetical protein
MKTLYSVAVILQMHPLDVTSLVLPVQHQSVLWAKHAIPLPAVAVILSSVAHRGMKQPVIVR